MNKEVKSGINSEFNKFDITETQDEEGNTLFVKVEHYSVRSQSTKFECFGSLKEQEEYVQTAIEGEAVDRLIEIFRKHESEVELHLGNIADVIIEDAYPELARSILKFVRGEE